jgi:hypothetical protein
MWESLAKDGLLKEAIVEFVRERDWVTLVELQRHMGDYMETKGHIALEWAPNLLLWGGMSQELVDLLIELNKEKRIVYYTTSALTYMADGGVVDLPVAKNMPKKGYKKPRWLPVCIRVAPCDRHRARRGRRR